MIGQFIASANEAIYLRDLQIAALAHTMTAIGYAMAIISFAMTAVGITMSRATFQR